MSDDSEAVKVDRSKLVIERVAWNERDYTVRYAGDYVGCIKLVGDNDYQIAVSMQRKKEKILQECGRADSIETGAEAVAYHWLLNREHEK